MKPTTVALGQAGVDPSPSETSGWLVDHSKNRFTIQIVQPAKGFRVISRVGKRQLILIPVTLKVLGLSLESILAASPSAV
jgi:hypothetical protein